MMFRRPVVALLVLMPAMAAVGCGSHTASLDGKNTEPRAALMTEPGGSGHNGSGDGSGHDGSGGTSGGHDGSGGGSGGTSGGHDGSGGGSHGISWPVDGR
ncbi:hypothetical protein [Segniliparus rugosus]|uniref:Lipoprotein n=1 Tax=Segniliparus rugosus (strain ATCC BAA-974 / DSM 45345 / CCUG 50838 / CIP 108380 / JCM 13579 / CDC 945) TaxID=679197 RepID=E5XQ14_SEGRC|nr:hypothetical protein [Segniliparus rugosus]EFV13570.2 hypothetical protein HMPREF9336_01586 [Segniliparus rugosus ATCC BAA-974]